MGASRTGEGAGGGGRRGHAPRIGILFRLGSAVAAPHPVFWAATAAVVAVDGIWLRAAGIRLEPEGFLAVAAGVGALLAIAATLGPVKSDPVWRGMTLASAALIAFTVPVAVLHYLTATLAPPLADPLLARAEAALGFDWPAYLAVLQAHPRLAHGLALAYHSSGPQVALVVFALGVTRRLGRLWAFVRLFAACLLCVVAVSTLLPAVGPYAHYAPRAYPTEAIETVGALWHLDPLTRLRAGTLRAIALADLRGLVTFPSFHVCLAVLTAWALAPIAVLGPAIALLSIAVAAASLSAGGHYLPDVLAGGLLAVVALLCRRASGHVVARSKGSGLSPARIRGTAAETRQGTRRARSPGGTGDEAMGRRPSDEAAQAAG